MSTPKEDGEQWHRDRWRNALFQDAELGPSPRLVASVLKEYTQRKARTVWLTLSQLEQETNTHRTTVQRAMKQLRERGWLTEIQPASGHRAAVYELTIPGRFTTPSSSAALPLSSSAALPQADLEVAPGVAIAPPSSSTALPNQEIKRSNPPTPRSIAAGLLDLDEDEDGELLDQLPQLLEDAERRMGQPIRSMKHFLTSKRADLRRELEQLRDELRPAPLQTFRTIDDPDWDKPTVPLDFIAAQRAQLSHSLAELADKTRIP